MAQQPCLMSYVWCFLELVWVKYTGSLAHKSRRVACPHRAHDPTL
jgi:hypothetical protein